MTLFSRVFGYIRDMVIAILLGASAGPAADAFIIAFRIPNFFRRLFAEGGFAAAFVPVFSECHEQCGDEAAGELAASVLGVLVTALLVVTVIGVLAAPLVISLFAAGWHDEPVKFALASELLRITFPYLLFISLTAFAAGILNTLGKFAVPAFAPVLLNFSMIGCALWLAPWFEQPVYALAVGVLIGGVAQVAIQLPVMARQGLLVRPRWRPRDPGVKRIFKLMIPAMFGISVSQVNLLVDTVLASFLVTGSVSWLYYSDRMMEFPLGVFGVAIATAILPTLSRSHARQDVDAFSRQLDWAMRITLVIGLPAAVGLALLGGPILATLFQYGEFTAGDVHMASLSLAAYSIGLLGFMYVKILAPGFFARQDTSTPVKIAAFAMLANIAMNLALIGPMAHVGLALATALGAYLNAGLLYGSLRRRGHYQPSHPWGGFALKVLLATVVMAAVLAYLLPAIDAWVNWPWQQRATQLGLWVAAGAVVYLLVLMLSGVRPRQLMRGVHSDS